MQSFPWLPQFLGSTRKPPHSLSSPFRYFLWLAPDEAVVDVPLDAAIWRHVDDTFSRHGGHETHLTKKDWTVTVDVNYLASLYGKPDPIQNLWQDSWVLISYPWHFAKNPWLFKRFNSSGASVTVVPSVREPLTTEALPACRLGREGAGGEIKQNWKKIFWLIWNLNQTIKQIWNQTELDMIQNIPKDVWIISIK